MATGPTGQKFWLQPQQQLKQGYVRVSGAIISEPTVVRMEEWVQHGGDHDQEPKQSRIDGRHQAPLTTPQARASRFSRDCSINHYYTTYFTT